jgi:NRPS condensation-like uncharacterized protein
VRSFTYRDGFKMKDVTVNADQVTFEFAHVVFWEMGKTKLVLAVSNEYVSELRQNDGQPETKFEQDAKEWQKNNPYCICSTGAAEAVFCRAANHDPRPLEERERNL